MAQARAGVRNADGLGGHFSRPHFLRENRIPSPIEPGPLPVRHRGGLET